MTLVVTSTDENVISIPTRLMVLLNLREGDEVKAIVEGESLRLASLDRFLALEGVLADNEEFDRAIDFLDAAWHSWIKTNSV